MIQDFSLRVGQNTRKHSGNFLPFVSQRMEDPQVQVYNPSLEKVLKSYQTVAMSSLGGPSSYRPSWPESAVTMAGKQLVDPIMKEAVARVSAVKSSVASVDQAQSHHHRSMANSVKLMEYDPLLHPPPFPIQQMPVFTPIDQTKSEKGITVLEDEDISCFTVGGEKRLCLPQILNSVLRDFSLQQINSVCDELHIYCSRCSPEQLEILKVTGILPFSAPSCGLITKTDAERLCNALLHGIRDEVSPKSLGASTAEEKPKHPTQNSIRVYHECFGKCKGLLTPELYETATSPCIECLECGAMLTPHKFIVHGHRRRETRTCHWGFDSDNWRNYLLLTRDQNPEEKYTEILEGVKAKFDPTCKYKRKQGLDENGNAKRLKPGEEDEEELSKDAIITSSWTGSVPLQRPSAFRPWSPSILNKEGKAGILPDHGTVLVRDRSGMPTYLSMGPPVLLNPERVVPHTAASKFDSQFAPNVALAPPMKLSPSSTESLSPDREKELDIKCEESDVPETTMEQEIEMVKTMLLEGDALDSRAGREKLLHEFYRIRIRHEERLQGALAAKRNLQQELEFLQLTKKDHLREALDSKRSLRKDMDRLRIEYERKLREANDSRQRLKRELEQARSRRSEKTTELGRSHDRLASQNEQLKDRVRELEEERDQLRRELEQHRRERRRRRASGLGKETEKKKEEEEGEEEEKEAAEGGAETENTTTKGAERRDVGEEKEESASPRTATREASSPEKREGRDEGTSRKGEQDDGEVERAVGEKKQCEGDKRRDGSADQSHPQKKK